MPNGADFSFFSFLFFSFLFFSFLFFCVSFGAIAGSWRAAVPPLLRQKGGHSGHGQERQASVIITCYSWASHPLLGM